MGRNIIKSIKTFNKNRKKDILPRKYAFMVTSDFRFYRGTCHLFYADLKSEYPFPSSPKVWICGDLHVENMGSFKGGNRLIYFDIADFDETILAPVLWDVLRLCTSIELATSELGFTLKERRNHLKTLLYHYKSQIISQKAIAVEKETAEGLIKDLFDKVVLRKAKALIKNRTSNNKLILGDRILALPKEEKKELLNHFDQWFKKNVHKDFNIVDAGYRIAGTGSIGVFRYLCLAVHNTDKTKKLLIDVKEATPSSLGKYIKDHDKIWANEAERVVKTQQLVQHVAPAFLSTFHHKDRWFVVKELQPTEDKIGLDNIDKDEKRMNIFMKDLGIIAASAHIRSSGRRGAASADKLKHFAETEDWIKEVQDWSMEYAQQVKKDYQRFCKAHNKDIL